MNLMILLLSFLAIIISLSVHEFMHGIVAYALGDQTARRAGRLTLNPIAHVDLIGTIVLPLILAASSLPVFGWAKPVPYNPYNLRNQKYGPSLVAIAGPLSNLAIFALASIGLHLLAPTLPPTNLLLLFLFLLAIVNASLAIFNILPVPPLDGSKLLYVWANHASVRKFIVFMELQGFWILLLYIAIGTPGLGWLLNQLFILGDLNRFVWIYQMAR